MGSEPPKKQEPEITLKGKIVLIQNKSRNTQRRLIR